MANNAVPTPATGENSASYFGNSFFAPAFPAMNRSVTGHDTDGKARFLEHDHGEHHQLRRSNGNEFAETVLYTTFGNPVDLNGDDDFRAARHDWQGGHHAKNGTRVTVLDIAPGGESPMHRGESIDYNLVLEGEIELILDSGEVTRLRRGDFNVQRCTAHKWRNVTDDGRGPARLFNVLIDIKPLIVNGQRMTGFSDGYLGAYGVGTERRRV